MTKTETKPETLPVDIGGGEIKFVSRTDYAKRTANTYTIKLGIKISKDDVMDILGRLDKGNRDLPDDSPEEAGKLFSAVIEDYDAGVAEVQRVAQEKKDSEEKEAREKKEKEETEAKLLVSVSKKSMDLGELAKKFDTGHMDRFIPKGDVTNEELLTAFKSSIGMAGFTDWMQGDLVVELEKRGLEGVVGKMAESLGVKYANIYRKARTCKAVPPDQRREGVSLVTYSELILAKFTDEQKKQTPALLKAIQEGKHTVQSARKEVQRIQGKTDDEVLPEEDEKKVFILVDTGLAGEGKPCVVLHTGFPKEQVGGGFVIINPSTKATFTNFSRKPENRWDAIPEYEAPKEEEKKSNGKKKK